jgi:hypothetical protein
MAVGIVAMKAATVVLAVDLAASFRVERSIEVVGSALAARERDIDFLATIAPGVDV